MINALGVSVLVLMSLVGAVHACSGCGCRGGPGYRGPNGQCVGHAQLLSTCGNPPTLRCSAEGHALMRLMEAERAKKQTAPIAPPASAAPPR